jgi:transcriptional regulator with XRE-family HTH domain
MSIFQKRLKMVMDEYSIKAADLAKGTGLTPGAISKILSDNRRKIHAETAFKVAGFLKIDPSWLYGLTDEKEQNKQIKVDSILQELSEEGKNKVLEYASFILNSEVKDKAKG